MIEHDDFVRCIGEGNAVFRVAMTWFNDDGIEAGTFAHIYRVQARLAIVTDRGVPYAASTVVETYHGIERIEQLTRIETSDRVVFP